VPGYDLHLNSMLGEADLLVGRLEPGDQMARKMAPTIGEDSGGLALAIGAAGGTRLRSAMVQVLGGLLDEDLSPGDAVDRPRLHPVGDLVHLEPGFPDGVKEALAEEGFTVREWPGRHHYFGGVSLVTRSAAAGDPRRSGGSRSLA
jgi:gamma-glutamyltranspeptidase/glutathione hydrolase